MIFGVAQGRVIAVEIVRIFVISVASECLLIYVKFRFSRIGGDVPDSVRGKDVKMRGCIRFRNDSGR
jgi:hypothetical protein